MLLVSEGGRDLGDIEGHGGAVRALVERIACEVFGRQHLRDGEIESRKLFRLHDKGYEEKARFAIVEAELRGATCVALVVDRDGPAGHQRLAKLRAGRDLAASEGRQLAQHTAVGLAVESVEAWLIADEMGLTKGLDLPTPVQAFPNPEDMAPGRAKVHFLAAVASSPAESGHYESVARELQIQVVETRCPAGFGAFANDLRHRVR